jgi:hypothetical protein
MYFRFLSICMIVGSSGFLSGCFTSTTAASSVNGVPGEVVERSREKAPSWAGLRPFMMHDQNQSFGYIHVENQHPDLPLGIKQTQLNALSQGKDVFKGAIVSVVSKAAEAARVTIDQINSGIAVHIDAASDQTWAPNAKVADIFFEKFRPRQQSEKGLAEFYNIYVMVEVPKTAMTESLRFVARRLKSSNKSELQRIGQALDSRISLAH